MDLKDALLFLTLLVCFPAFNYAQTNSANHKINCEIPEVALLGLVSENEANINLSAIAPNEAGNAISSTDETNNNIWINYSSIIANKNHNRKIIAMVQGEIPKGIQIKVQASEATGSGKGKTGQPSGLVTLSNEPSEIIVGIGSCFTGKGSNNGHYLSYKLEIDDAEYSQLSNISEPLSVVYTLTDQN